MTDLLSNPSVDAARRCGIRVDKMETIIDVVCKDLYHEVAPESFSKLSPREVKEEMFMMGDFEIDKALGGGIRTGMVWEICGERSGQLSVS